jgi:hypothetical protein
MKRSPIITDLSHGEGAGGELALALSDPLDEPLLSAHGAAGSPEISSHATARYRERKLCGIYPSLTTRPPPRRADVFRKSSSCYPALVL